MMNLHRCAKVTWWTGCRGKDVNQNDWKLIHNVSTREKNQNFLQILGGYKVITVKNPSFFMVLGSKVITICGGHLFVLDF